MGGRSSSNIHLAGKDGYYTYLFGPFRFREAIPSRLRRFIEAVPGGEWSSSPVRETSPFRDGGSPSRVKTEATNMGSNRSNNNDVVFLGPDIGVALNNLLFLFRILLLYQKTAHFESFYDVVGKDLDDWPADVVEDTQRIFVEGRRLFLSLPESNVPFHQHPRVQMLCNLVKEWEAVRPRPGQMPPASMLSPEELHASWTELRKFWRRRYQSDPNSLLVNDDGYRLSASHFIRLGPPERPLSPTVEQMKRDEEEATTILASIPLHTSAAPVVTSPVVRAWVDQLASIALHSRRVPQPKRLAYKGPSLPPLKPPTALQQHQMSVSCRAREEASTGRNTPGNDGDSLHVPKEARNVSLSQQPERREDLIPVRHSGHGGGGQDTIEATKRTILLTISQISALLRPPKDPKNSPGPIAPVVSIAGTNDRAGSSPPIIDKNALEASVDSTPMAGVLKEPLKGHRVPAKPTSRGPHPPQKHLPSRPQSTKNPSQAAGKNDKLPDKPTQSALQLRHVPLQPPQPTSNSSPVIKSFPDKGDRSEKANDVPLRTPPLSSTLPVYKARRTPGDPWRRIENRDTSVAALSRPPVRNVVGALAAAAIASAQAPTLVREASLPPCPTPKRAPSIIPADGPDASVETPPPESYSSSPSNKTPQNNPKTKGAQGKKTPEKKTIGTKVPGKQALQKGRAIAKAKPVVKDKSVINNDYTMTNKGNGNGSDKNKAPEEKECEDTAPEKYTPRPKVSQKGLVTTTSKTDASTKVTIYDDDTITDKSSGAGSVALELRAESGAVHIGSPPSKDINARMNKPSSTRPSKPNARRLTMDSLENIAERPRKRVSFGGTSYDKPERASSPHVAVGASLFRNASASALPRPAAPAVPIHTEPVLISTGVRVYPTCPYGAAREAKSPEGPQETTKEVADMSMTGMGPVAQPGMQLAVFPKQDVFFDPVLADHRDSRIMALLMSIKTQVDEQTHLLKQLIMPETTDLGVRRHLEMVSSQMQSLSYASYVAWDSVNTKQKEERRLHKSLTKG